MDGGAGRFDIAVVEARKFLSTEIEGMSEWVKERKKVCLLKVHRSIAARELSV
jgi:hypothetical protein